MSLQKKAMHGMLWNLAERSSVQIVQFGISLVLARLLSPAEFGMVGMLMVFTALAQVFLDAGFSSALIQKKEVTQEDLSSVFYLNILMGSALTALLYFSAPYIARFYNQPELESLARISSFTLLIGSFAAVQYAQISREMNFKLLSKVSFLSAIVSGGVGISMAFMGYGVWALVWQGIVGAMSRMVFIVFFNRWIPSLTFSSRAVRQLFDFGSNIFAARLLDAGFQQIYTLVIGKVYSATDLGFYSRAKRLQTLTVQNLSASFNSVLFPVLSQVQDDPVRFERGFRKALRISTFFNVPLMLGLAVMASPLILFLYGEKWAEAASYFQLLCLAALPIPINQLNNNALMSLGYSGKLFWLSVIKKTVSIIIIAVTFRHGILALVTGSIVGAFIATFIGCYVTGRIIGISLLRQIKDIAPISIISVVMALFVWLVGNSTGVVFIKLILQAVCGGGTYFILCRLMRPMAYIESIQQLAGMMPSKAKIIIFKLTGIRS